MLYRIFTMLKNNPEKIEKNDPKHEKTRENHQLVKNRKKQKYLSSKILKKQKYFSK